MTTRRFESIGNILSSRSAELAQPAHDEPLSAPAAEPSPTPVTELRPATSSSPRRPDTTKRPPRSAAATGGVRRIAFRLDPDLHSALTARAGATNSSHGQVVLDSIEATHASGALTDLIAQEHTAGQTGGLFPRLATRSPVQPTVPVEIRLHAGAVTVLDQLVDKVGAQSRTQLIVTALRHHLT